MKNIQYKETRKPQPYLTNPRINNEMCALLFNLGCKCEKSIDSQKQALTCELVKKELTEYEQNVLSELLVDIVIVLAHINN